MQITMATGPSDVRLCTVCKRIYEPHLDAWEQPEYACDECKSRVLSLRLFRVEIRVEGCPCCQWSEAEKDWLLYMRDRGIIALRQHQCGARCQGTEHHDD